MSACSERSSASTPPVSTGFSRKSSGRCGCCEIRSSPYSAWRSSRIRMTFAGRPASGSSPDCTAPGPSCASTTLPPPGSSKGYIRPMTASPMWNQPLRRSRTPTRWSSSPTGRSSSLWTSAGSGRSCEVRSSLTGEISSSRRRCRRPGSSTTASAAGRRPSARNRNGCAYERALPIFRDRDARARFPGLGVGGHRGDRSASQLAHDRCADRSGDHPGHFPREHVDLRPGTRPAARAGQIHLRRGRTRAEAGVEPLVRAKVPEWGGHPALLCYAIGNEIPSTVARWLGRRKIERYLKRLCHAVKEEDPDGLVTYVNYPTTEYLQL